MSEINHAKQESGAKLIVLCGPSHAGKTTFARQLSKNFTIIGTDDIRKRLGCSFDGSRYETKVWDVFEAMKCRALEEGRNVILDACHRSRQARWHSLQGPNAHHRKICVVFDLPIQSIRERCLKANRISLKEVERMWRVFQNSKPTSEELKRQGFDEVYFVKEYPGATFTNCLSENFKFRGDGTVTTMDLPKVSSSFSVAGEAVARYAACVFAPTDIVEVRRLPSGKNSWHRAANLAEAAQNLFYDNQRGLHIHVGANPRRVQGGTRSKDVACGRCLFVDFDGIDHDAAQGRWHKAGLPMPTLTIASGHGIHAYWRLVKPMMDMAQWTTLQKKIIALLDSDAAIHDPARIMRLPGFINHKEPVGMCSIIDADQARIYDLESLMPSLNSVAAESEYNNQPRQAVGFTAQLEVPLPNDPKVIKMAELTAAKWSKAPKGQRNCKAFQNAAYLVKNLGLTKEQSWLILHEWNRRNTPSLPEWELRQALQNAIIYGRHQVGNR